MEATDLRCRLDRALVYIGKLEQAQTDILSKAGIDIRALKEQIDALRVTRDSLEKV